jgi:hypothetical protein
VHPSLETRYGLVLRDPLRIPVAPPGEPVAQGTELGDFSRFFLKKCPKNHENRAEFVLAVPSDAQLGFLHTPGHVRRLLAPVGSWKLAKVGVWGTMADHLCYHNFHSFS